MAGRQNLLLIPGLVCDAAVWRYPAEHLADIAEVSIPPATQGETMADMARIALDSAPDEFALAGFSMGGYVALEMLRQAPERIMRLALLDSSARADTPEKAESRRIAIAACERGEFAAVIDRMMPILLHPAHQSGHLPAFVREMVGRIGSEVFVRRLRAIAGRQDSRELLRKTTQPVRALCGREDAMTSIADHIEIAELAPNGRFSLIEECGHMTIIERPQAATALLRDWLVYG